MSCSDLVRVNSVVGVRLRAQFGVRCGKENVVRSVVELRVDVASRVDA